VNPVISRVSCGGLKQIDHPVPRPKILLKLEIRGKARWPFGWEILRELAGFVSPDIICE